MGSPTSCKSSIPSAFPSTLSTDTTTDMKSGAVDAMVRKKSSQTSAGLETVPSKYEGIVNDATNVVNYQTMQWWHAGTG